jgi:hypothetical protein
MEDEAKTEDIANGIIFGFHIFDVDYFRSNISWSPTTNEEVLLSLSKLSQSKICDDTLPAAFGPED